LNFFIRNFQISFPDYSSEILIIIPPYFQHYFHSILINDLLPSSFAFYYLQEKMSDYKQNSGGSSHIDVINQRLLGYYQGGIF